MITLRRRLAIRYGVVVAICVLLLASLGYHEFVRAPDRFRKLGIGEPPESESGQLAEIILYAMVPILFTLGWWFVRRSLIPIDDLALGVEGFDLHNLRQRLPRTQNGDEVDRLAAAFNGLADRLARSFAQIQEFSLQASHELKTPLTVMRAQLETALAEPHGLSTQCRESMHVLLDEVQRLARIVDGLTLLTKADAGLVTLERKPVQLDELVREGAEDALVLAQPHGIVVRLDECEPALVSGDRHRLRQVLLNLTDNAVKYNQPEGRIQMALRREGDRAVFEISNTGVGIPSELQPRIFDRFVRGSRPSVYTGEGCGIGLAIVKWIVEAHSGSIKVASEPGRTATFTVVLPLALQR